MSCQTLFKKEGSSIIPSDLSSYTKGTLSGIVTLYYKNKKQYFSSDIFIFNKNLRIDLSLSFGIPIITVLLKQDTNELTVLFLQTKEFYKGKIQNFMDIPKDLDFIKLLLDQIPDNKKWTCKINKKYLPIKCTYQQWKLLWKRKHKRKIIVKNNKFKFKFKYLSFSTQIEKESFNVKIPKYFKQKLILK